MEQTGQKELLFNATNARHTPPMVRPLEEQGDRESQKLWYKTVLAIKDRNHELATDEKTKIEDMQRDEAARRQEDGVDWQPRFFRRVRGGPGGPEEGEEDLDWILNADMYVARRLLTWIMRLTHSAVTVPPPKPRPSKSSRLSQ
jgi:hypothetical protein